MEICLKRYRGHKTIRKRPTSSPLSVTNSNCFITRYTEEYLSNLKLSLQNQNKTKSLIIGNIKKKKFLFLKVKNYLRQYIEMNVAPVSFFRR